MLHVERSTTLVVSPIKVKNHHRGADTEQYLERLDKDFTEKQVITIAEKSLEKLKENTPSDSGLTASSWEYEIKKDSKGWLINFNNTNIQNGMNIALLIENGHATAGGKWISGRPYLEKTFREIQKDIIDKAWEERTKV